MKAALLRLLSRKFLVALLSLLSLSVLCWFAKIDPGVYATGLVATVGAYLTSNVVAKREAK